MMRKQKISLHLLTTLIASLLLVLSVLLIVSAKPSTSLLPPLVLPIPNTHSAPLTTPITIIYTSAISPATVNTQTVAVHAMQSGLLTQTYRISENVVSLLPAQPFKPGELVQVSASDQVLSLDGQSIISPTVWQFRTAVNRLSGGEFLNNGVALSSTFVSDMKLGDLDSDGDLDLFVTNGSRNSDEVWLNDGHGAFTHSGQIFSNTNSTSLALGDLDGDGDLDALVAERDGSPSKVWLNAGQGDFTHNPISGTLNVDEALWVDLGDLDGDGDLDAFLAKWNDLPNEVWFNDGGGHFSDSGQRLGGLRSLGVVLGDLDGDGDLDAFVINWNDEHDTVWLNNGRGVFSDSGQQLGRTDSQAVSLGDVDGDGDLDAFVANQKEQPNRVWLNDGFANFSDSGQRLGDSNGEGVSLGDLDGDGDLDAFVANEYIKIDNLVLGQPDTVWLNDGEGHFSDSGQRIGASDSQTSPALGDLDGDGDLDAVIGSRDTGVWAEPDDVVSVDIFKRVWFNHNLPRLVIRKTAPLTAKAGRLLTYTLQITNIGFSAATNLIITDAIPADAIYAVGGQKVGQIISWAIPSLEVGDSIQVQFAVTATQTALNSRYRVSADNDISTTGEETIITFVSGCPPISTYVCAFDEEGQAISDAHIYRNGRLVVDVNGDPRLTDSQGFITFTKLITGETLAALQLVYQQPTHKAVHNPDGDDNFAFRVYRSSMPVSDDGEAAFYTVAQEDQSHTLTVNPTNTLILFNVVASVEWDASSEEGAYIDELKMGLEKASDFLYDATDGQMAFGWITIYDNAEHWGDADIQIRTHNHTWPHAYVGGINPRGDGHLVYKGIDPEPGQIVLGRAWDGYGASNGPWNNYDGYATIAHEFGHYALFLFDEYFYYDDSGGRRVARPSRCAIDDTYPASLMYSQYSKTELCSRPEHYPEYTGGPPTRQTQVYSPTESSWVTIKGVYSDVLQSLSPISAPWRIIAPTDRQTAPDFFVTGPSHPPLDGLLIIEDRSQDTAAFSRKVVTVQNQDGSPIWGALVSLHRANGATLDQGLTDRQGKIEVLGAGDGDIIRVRTADNGLSGSLTIADASNEEIVLTPVLPSRAVLINGQTAIANSAPLVTIIPRSDGATIDYFVANADPLSHTVHAQIGGAQAPPIAQKTMAYDSTAEHYFVEFSGFSTGALSGLLFQMTATVGVSGFVEIGIGHDRNWTEGGPDELNLMTTDGNLILNAPGGSFDRLTYVVANPTSALPGPSPTDTVSIGQSYSLQPSGAISKADKAMTLDIIYHPLSLGEVDESTLTPYYWSAAQQIWTPVMSYTLNTTINRVSASVELFGIYALFGRAPAPRVDGVTPGVGSINLPLSVVITGGNFQSGAQVRIGDSLILSADNATYVNAQTLLTSLPDSLLPGVYGVAVINPDGQEGTLPNALTIYGNMIYLPLVLK